MLNVATELGEVEKQTSLTFTALNETIGVLEESIKYSSLVRARLRCRKLSANIYQKLLDNSGLTSGLARIGAVVVVITAASITSAAAIGIECSNGAAHAIRHAI